MINNDPKMKFDISRIQNTTIINKPISINIRIEIF